MTKRHAFDPSATYEIRVRGTLDSSWSDCFDGFSVTIQGDETALVGIVVDQAALHGILVKINDLGLSLISLNKLPN